MYNKPRSVEFINQIYKDNFVSFFLSFARAGTEGRNNPCAEPTMPTGIRTKNQHVFDTSKDACIFLKGTVSHIRLARDTNTPYNN